MQRAEGTLEHLDRAIAPAERDASLADIDRLNARFGGYSLTLRALDRLVRRTPASRPLLVVDVGGGRGDFARRLIRHMRRRGRAVHVVVVDRDPDLLAVARRAALPNVSLVRADASALPFRARAVDVVTMSLTLHHMEPDAAVASLGEMSNAAREAIIVNDLWRSRLSLALVWLATAFCAATRSPVTTARFRYVAPIPPTRSAPSPRRPAYVRRASGAIRCAAVS